MIFQKLNTEELSKVQVTYFNGLSNVTNRCDVLIIKFSGVYNTDSDAQYMYAKGEFGLNCYKPKAVILDFSDLEYVWGDMMDYVFNIGSNQYIDSEFPKALVIGDKCERAIGTLVHGINSNESATTEEWIFDDLETAFDFLEK